MGSLDDDDLVDRRLRHPVEHLAEVELLLGRAEPRRFSRSEDDRGDHLDPAVTLSMTTTFVGVPFGSDASPSLPIRSTVAMPRMTRPTTA